VKTGKLLICFLAVSGGIFSLTCSGFAHLLSANGASNFYYAFSESTLALKNDNFNYPRFFAGSVEPGFETRLFLFQKAPLSTTHPLPYGERSSIIFRPEQKGINYKRASIIGMVNAGAIFFGFKQAIASWGKSDSGFHFKDDWKGDNLAQTDELSHFIWGYKMTQFFFWAYDWVGLSSKTSQALSISQSALLLTLVEYPIDAYNPKQGLGVSDLIFDYVGVGLAYMKKHKSWLEDFDFKISWKKNIFLANQPMFAQTYEEFDNFIYWFTYRTKLFMPRKIFCFGVGYSVFHPGDTPKRQFYGGIGLSLPDFASLFGKNLKTRVKFLEIFYPNLSIKF
jgi:hypothetical protein